MPTESDDPIQPALYLVATPIGNLEDLTFRALKILKKADRLLAEDTRRTLKLLRHFEIDRALQPCHEHNESSMAGQVVSWIREGQSCAFVSDAGTPAISDPGFRLVRSCRELDLPVISIPGPCAAIAALSVSGLPTDQFRFLGFLPPKRAARIRVFHELKDDSGSLIFYESTHRIEKFLEDAEEVFGKTRAICVGRELTKQFETVTSGTLENVRSRLATASTKGEFVIIVAKNDYSIG